MYVHYELTLQGYGVILSTNYCAEASNAISSGLAIFPCKQWNKQDREQKSQVRPYPQLPVSFACYCCVFRQQLEKGQRCKLSFESRQRVSQLLAPTVKHN